MPTRIFRRGNGKFAAITIAMALPMLAAIGCDDDARLVEHARQSSERQAQQNETIARQSREVTEQNHRFAQRPALSGSQRNRESAWWNLGCQ